MLESIQRFISELRKAGVRVSPAEAIDAARAVQVVGVERRDPFRLALKSTLSKRREDAVIFDRAFDRFFSSLPADSSDRRRGQGLESSPAGAGKRRRASTPDEETPPGAGARRADDGREPRARAGRLKVIATTQRGLAAGRPAGRPEAPRRHEPPRALIAGARPRSPTPRPRRLTSTEPSTYAAPADPLRIDLSLRLTSVEEEAVAREVPRLIREIRLKTGRRHRRGGSGRLWAARLMRENVGTGGVPFVIPLRERRKRRPRAIVLVDVSWSVMRASSLFLMMAREFVEGVARASIHFFVDRCVEATDAVARWKGPEQVPFARLLDRVADLDPKAASDHGRAFYQAIRSRHGTLRSGGRDTILIVLGDARNNFRDAQSWAFGELAARCRRVIWLNPEPISRWNTGDSVLDEYLPHCDVVCEAKDLLGLARGVSEIARSL